jgi:hypothetical protein
VGFSVSPLVLNRHQLVLAADALHVNNNNESVNIGAEYRLSAPGMGMVFFRGGYRALFLEESQFGPTFGFGTRLQMIRDTGIQVDYAYRDIGLLGYVNVFGVRILF